MVAASAITVKNVQNIIKCDIKTALEVLKQFFVLKFNFFVSACKR